MDILDLGQIITINSLVLVITPVCLVADRVNSCSSVTLMLIIYTAIILLEQPKCIDSIFIDDVLTVYNILFQPAFLSLNELPVYSSNTIGDTIVGTKLNLHFI